MWQDYVFSTGIVVFNVALIPALKAKGKPPLLTAAPTAFFQYIFVIAFATLGLWFSAVFTLTLGFIWTALTWQSYKQSKPKKKARK